MSKSINQIDKVDIAMFKSGDNAMNDADFYQHIANKSAFYPGRFTTAGLVYVALKLNGEAGEFAEHVGKAMRDDQYGQQVMVETGVGMMPEDIDLTPERRALLIKEIGDVLWYCSAACNELGIKLSEAMAENLEKLYKRTEANTLRGSGDDR